MKKYLFGLGAMLVGAGLMFVLIHGEVSAEGEFLVGERDLADIFDFDRAKHRGNRSFKNKFKCNNEFLREKAGKDINYSVGEIKVCKSEEEEMVCIFNVGNANLIDKQTSMSCMKS